MLRLFYGLKSGFQISVDQLHSMLKVSYWQSAGQAVESISLRAINEQADVFWDTLPFPSGGEKKGPFIKDFLSNQQIPETEKSILVLKLSDEYTS